MRKKKVKNFQAWMWTWECCLGVFDIHVSENMCENVCKYVSNVKKVIWKGLPNGPKEYSDGFGPTRFHLH